MSDDDALRAAARQALNTPSGMVKVWALDVLRLTADNDRLRAALHVAQPAVEILREKCVNDEARAVVQQALDLMEAALSGSPLSPTEAEEE